MKALKLEEESAEVKTRYCEASLLEILEVLRESHHLYFREAWAELHTRFSNPIVKATKDKTYTYKFDSPEELAEDIAYLVFKKILDKIDQCPIDSSLVGDSKKQEVKFMGWVFGIINYTFIDVTRKNKKQQGANESFFMDSKEIDVFEANYIEFYEDESEEGIVQDEYDIQKEQLDNAMKLLTSDEKLIIATYRDFGYIEDGKWILPIEYKNKLLEKFGIKSNSLDRKKSRIVLKLKKHIKSD